MSKAEPEAPAVEIIGTLIMSGHCSFPVTGNPQSSHDRCARNGAGSRANPMKIFTPCPCECHLGETFECSGCGRDIREALAWPFDEDGDIRYTHITADGRACGEDCSGPPPRLSALTQAETKPDEVLPASTTKSCIRCGDEFKGEAALCKGCLLEDEEAALLAELDEDDEFASLLAELDGDD